MSSVNLAYAVVFGCLVLAVMALDLAGKLLSVMSNDSTDGDRSVGCGFMAFVVLIFAIVMVAFAFRAAIPA